MNNKIQNFISKIILEFDQIGTDRKTLLKRIAGEIKEIQNKHQAVRLVFICTHNSRRSHFGQIWAQTAADHYGCKSVDTFSGGTEETAVNKNVIKALTETGFDITIVHDGENPKYAIKHGGNSKSIEAFSKVFNDPANPFKDFMAIMTCTDAEKNCPFIEGAAKRISLTYNDPKAFDGTDREFEAYREKNQEIAREMFFLFSQI